MRHLILLLLFLPVSANAQVLKMNNCLSANWSNNGSKKIFKYNPSIGLEYLESRYFLLSSTIGISHKCQEYPIYDGEARLQSNIKYIELSTTGRFKLDLNTVNFYIGIGPTIDWKTKSEYTAHGKLDENSRSRGDFIARKNVINVLSEIGAYKDFNRLRLELFASYKTNLTNVIPESRIGFIGHSLSLNLSFGYKL